MFKCNASLYFYMYLFIYHYYLVCYVLSKFEMDNTQLLPPGGSQSKQNKKC